MSAEMRHQQAERTSEEPQEESSAGEGAGDGGEQQWAPLLAETDVRACRSRWGEIQASFVDQPRESVEQADRLVAELMQQLTASFSQQRSRLEEHWDGGDDVSTEELRVALTRYRSFFNRLLAA